MNTELSAFAAAAANPFAALMSPEIVIAAHERMATRVTGVVHRPLDKPRLVRTGQEALAAVDAEVDAENFDDSDSAFDSDCDISDIVSGTHGAQAFVPAPRMLTN
jgi:hypothetical protein